MSSKLPLPVIAWVSAMSRKRIQNHRISPDRVDIYVQSTSDHFNEIVADHLILRRAHAGFNEPEHADWVYPAFCFRGGAQVHPNRISPLNSWVLKSPVDSVPTFDQIREEHEWRYELVRASTVSPKSLVSLEELQEDYVKKVCEQVIDHIKQLEIWREAGMPREQQDCFTGMDKKKLKHVSELQRFNRLDAKENLDILTKFYAPTFMIERTKAALAKERLICDQITNSMRYC